MDKLIKNTWDLTHEEKLSRLTTEFYEFGCVIARGYPRLELIPPRRYYEDLQKLRNGATVIRKPKMKYVGRSKFDFVPCNTVDFISDRMKQLFEHENFTGWDTFKINRTDDNPAIFHGLVVTGCATKHLGGYSPQHGVTVGFEKQSWDGSDFFHIVGEAGGKGFTILTKRVVEALIAAKARGFSITPIDPAGTLLDSLTNALWFK